MSAYGGFNPIQDGLFWGCSCMAGKKATLPKICHTSYNDETWHSYALPKEDQQIIWIMWHTHPLSSADVSIFSVKIAKFCYIRKCRYGFYFDAYLLTFSVFFGSLKIAFVNMLTILMMSAKMATLGLLKIKLFWNNSYGVIISDHDVTNKMLSWDSNYIVGVVM